MLNIIKELISQDNGINVDKIVFNSEFDIDLYVDSLSAYDVKHLYDYEIILEKDINDYIDKNNLKFDFEIPVHISFECKDNKTVINILIEIVKYIEDSESSIKIFNFINNYQYANK